MSSVKGDTDMELDINDLALLVMCLYYIGAIGLAGWCLMKGLELLSSWSERWHERRSRRMPNRIAGYRR